MLQKQRLYGKELLEVSKMGLICYACPPHVE